MNFVEARDNWKANDGWEFADRDVAWNYFFTAGMIASDEIHKPLVQQASDWYALYAKEAKKRVAEQADIAELRSENFALRQIAKPDCRRIEAEMNKRPEHGAHQFCGNHSCVICALTPEEVKAIWLGCTSIDNEAFCAEFSRKLLAAAVAAANKTPNDGGERR